MKEKLIIIGAGNVGGFLSYNIDEFGNYDVLGFLDDDVNKQKRKLYGLPVLGLVSDIENFIHGTSLSIVIGMASPKAKRSIVQKLERYALNYPNFIARNVWLSKNVALGKGVILYPGVSVNYETDIGDYVIMNMNCAVGHNCSVDNFVSLAPGVNLAGFTRIEEGVDMGIGASTRQNVIVGRHAVVGGQSMVVKNIPDDSVVVGVPGKVIKSSSL